MTMSDPGPVAAGGGGDAPGEGTAAPGRGAVLWKALEAWIDHGAPTRSAAIAFYSLTSLAPISLVFVWIGTNAWERGAVRGRVVDLLAESIGPEATALVEAVLDDASLPSGEATLPALISVVVFAFAATAVFAQLQAALRDIWGIPSDPTHRVSGFLRRRLIALLLVGALGIVLLLSMILTVVVAAAADRLPTGTPPALLWAANVGVSSVTLIALFTLVFRFLPDAHVQWRVAAVGGFVSAILHVAGQWVVGLYLGRSAVGSAYGAAAARVVLLTWIYYSPHVFLLGAELTKAAFTARGGER